MLKYIPSSFNLSNLSQKFAIVIKLVIILFLKAVKDEPNDRLNIKWTFSGYKIFNNTKYITLNQAYLPCFRYFGKFLQPAVEL